MLENFRFFIDYKADGVKKTSDRMENADYAVSYKHSASGLKLSIKPKKQIEMVKTSIVIDYDYKDDCKVFVNGYQSWTTTREYRKTDRQTGLRGAGKYWPVKLFAEIFGDYFFTEYSKKCGFFHSFTYGYIKNEDKLTFIGSLSERNGYTILYYDMNENYLRIDKDVEGVTIDSEYVLFDLVTYEGSENVVFDKYFAAMNISKPRMEFMCGYTSWYNYFGTISEKQLLRDLDGMAKVVGNKADIFQIDDGYQKAIGEWLSVDEGKFPNGMKYLADKIHSNGYRAGIWLAPFFVQHNSILKTEKPEWLIKDDNGKPLVGAINWGGKTLILDIYHPEAREYIKNFFHVILNEWGFDMVKLDFLYAACIKPRLNKSRGQLMCEAMDFLREACGDKIILGCGVPLAPSFGKVDFCRISCDVELSFKDRFYTRHTNREIVSAKNAMNNSIFRRHLDGRAFGNDPDVFFLRENDLTGKDEYFIPRGRLQYTFEQKKLLAKINNMFGKVLFVSDNIGGYGEEEIKLLEESFTCSNKVVLDAEYSSKDTIAIKYIEDGATYKLEFNTLTGENKTVKL